MTLPSYVIPPPRPASPISPLVVRAKQTFFYEDYSPSDSSPLSETSDYYCLRQGTPFRQQWANVSDAPTPPPQSMIPTLPIPSAAQRAAIRLWESRVSRGTPAPPSPPTPAPQMTFNHQSSHLELSPVEYDIQELSTQIQDIHNNLARSESLFKQGMLSVYLQQNAAAARLASSPTDNLPTDFMQRPSSVDSVSSTASFHRREAVARQRAVEARTRAMVAAQEREEQRKDFLKMTLVDRIEREVNEIERRAIRDLEMVREARYALHMELERERARERRRALEAELAIERERQEAEDARREDEEEAARLLAVISQATEAFDVVAEPETVATTTTKEAEEDEDEDEEEEQTDFIFSQECFFQLSPEMAGSTPSLTLSASPSLSHSMSTRPSTPFSIHDDSTEDKNEYFTAIASARNTPPTLAIKTCMPLTNTSATTGLPTAGLPTSGSLKSPLFTFLASPISPCSPSMPVAFTFASARNSLNMEVGLGFELTFAETAELNNMEFNMSSSTAREGVSTGRVAACA